MDTRPEPPPEGRLIEAATRLLDISIREAARRAGISYGRWRQIVKGYQNVSPGEYAAVRNAPAATIAKMARAAGVTPAQLAAEGCRPDAAAVLADLLAADDEPTLAGILPAPAATDPLTVRIGQAIADEMTRIRGEEVAVRLTEIAAEIRDYIAARREDGIPEREIFEDKFERNLWLTELTPEDQRVLAIAALRSVRPRRPNSDTSPPPPIELAG
jgi:hypothetical protein